MCTGEGGDKMQSIVQGVIETFGIGEIPTDFPSFIYWFVTVIAAITVFKIVMGTFYGIYTKTLEVRR